MAAGLNAFLDGPESARAALAELSGVALSDLGSIDLRPNFAFIDVEPAAADRFIEGLAGKEVRGKGLRAERARARGGRRERSSRDGE